MVFIWRQEPSTQLKTSLSGSDVRNVFLTGYRVIAETSNGWMRPEQRRQVSITAGLENADACTFDSELFPELFLVRFTRTL